MISDQDCKLTPNHWQEDPKRVEIQLQMSRAFHPPTYRQTEQINLVVEADLRIFFIVEYNNRMDLAYRVEFNTNDSKGKGTVLTSLVGYLRLYSRSNETIMIQCRNWENHIFDSGMDRVDKFVKNKPALTGS